jgi:hypothetical protein
MLTTCNNLVDTIRLVAGLFQQVRYSHDITILNKHRGKTSAHAPNYENMAGNLNINF